MNTNSKASFKRPYQGEPMMDVGGGQVRSSPVEAIPDESI